MAEVESAPLARPRRRAASTGAAITISRRGAAALYIERQRLDRPRGRRLTAASLVGFAEAVGGVQIDSINVVDRAHHLTLWSRFGPYDRATLDKMLYRDRVLFEYWAHAACFVPRSHWPAWRRTMLDFETRNTGWSRWLRRNGKIMSRVEAAIRERGPLGNVDFREARPQGTAGWWNWKPATHALQLLWFRGVLTVHSRVHFQKRFDLTERAMAREMTLSPLDAEAFTRWHVLRSLEAMGFATEADLRMYLSYPRMAFGQRRRALASLLASGEVLPVLLEGGETRGLARAVDVPELERASRRRTGPRGTTLLSPFDSFLWHRERIEQLFGFQYRIEVYVPGDRRSHGYYSLPVYHDGQLIGRVDAKNHRKERRLELRHAHFESWFARGESPPAASWGPVDRDAGLAGVADAVASLATFLGAESVTLARVSPKALTASLRRALKTRPVDSASQRCG